MKTETKQLGQNIKNIRERRSITSQAVATLLDMSLSGYSKIERGETDPQWTRVLKLAEILQVTLDELQNYENSKPLAQSTVGTINNKGAGNGLVVNLSQATEKEINAFLKDEIKLKNVQIQDLLEILKQKS